MPKSVSIVEGEYSRCVFTIDILKYFSGISFLYLWLWRMGMLDPCRPPARPNNWCLTVVVNPIQCKICPKFKPNSWSVAPRCHIVRLICQFLSTALDDIILHLSSLERLSCQTRCQASLSCWCRACWAPPGDSLTPRPTFPLRNPPLSLSALFTLLSPSSRQLLVLPTTSQNLRCGKIIITQRRGATLCAIMKRWLCLMY